MTQGSRNLANIFSCISIHMERMYYTTSFHIWTNLLLLGCMTTQSKFVPDLKGCFLTILVCKSERDDKKESIEICICETRLYTESLILDSRRHIRPLLPFPPSLSLSLLPSGPEADKAGNFVYTSAPFLPVVTTG